MAIYGINKEGAEALNQLANDLDSINKDIEEDGKKLKATVSALDENLGIYSEQIFTIIERVNTTQETGREEIQQLSSNIKKKAIEIETIANNGLG